MFVLPWWVSNKRQERNWSSFRGTWVQLYFFGGIVLLIFLVFCVVLCFILLISSCVLCSQCCKFLWIIHSWLPLRFSPTFYQMHAFSLCCFSSFCFFVSNCDAEHWSTLPVQFGLLYNFQNVDDIFIQTIDHDCIDSNKAIRWFLRWFHWSLPMALTMDNELIDSIEHLSNCSRLVGLFQNKRLLVIISGVRFDKYGLWAVANHRDPYL
jgi:hypothetical protein